MSSASLSLFGLKPHSDDTRCAWVALLMAGIVVWTFWDVRVCEFNTLDDAFFVVGNPYIQEGFTWKGIRWAWTADLFKDSVHADYWQPVTMMSRMLDVQLFGMDPVMHHWMNLMYHLANTLLLFFVMRQMTGMMWRSAMVAILFGVHPTRVESIAWVTERKDELAGLFWILTIWAYWWYTRAPNWKRYLLVAGCFALGLMSKPMVITLPCVLLLLDFWPLKRLPLDWKKREVWLWRILEKLPLLPLVLISAVLTLKFQGNAMQDHSFTHMASNALSSYAASISKQIMPVHLSLHYPRLQAPLTAVDAALDLSLLVTLVLALRFARQWPWLITGLLWFLGTLVPVLFVEDLITADRFSYIPCIGLFIVIVWGIAEMAKFEKWPQWVPAVIATIVVFMLVAGSRIQTRHWRNGLLLAEHDLGINPDDYMARCILASFYLDHGRRREAIEQLQYSVQVEPRNPIVFNNLGTALAQDGRMDEAREDYIRAVQLDARYVTAYFNLGKLLQDKGQTNEALQHYKEAVRIEPLNAMAWYNMGNIQRRRQQIPEAIASYQSALQADPASDKIHNNLAICLAQQGKLDDAIQHYMAAIRSNSHDADVHCNLGIALMRQGRLDEAVACFQKALRIKPGVSNAVKGLEHIREVQKANPPAGLLMR